MEDAAADALVEAVRQVAKAEILPRFRDLSPAEIETKSGPEDLVTIADRAAEAALEARIAAILPGAAVVGEEACEAEPQRLDALGRPGTVVVIDPIDGTWNFARGLATFGVILAVVEDGRTVFGLLYDPVLDDWMAAREGQGAFYCRPGRKPERLRTALPRPPERQTGYLPLNLFDGAERPALAGLLPSFGRVQFLRCSCHEYRMLAAGHVDWLVAAQSKPWDHLAGRLLVAEAGGAAGTLAGGDHDPRETRDRLIAAASGRLLADIRRRVGDALEI